MKEKLNYKSKLTDKKIACTEDYKHAVFIHRWRMELQNHSRYYPFFLGRKKIFHFFSGKHDVWFPHHRYTSKGGYQKTPRRDRKEVKR